ncbi:phosphoglycolate phosphatase [Alcaligenaceae bacterium CGII-47]|nr:phosphoglycolate phosphatase [Alcaligenaceae bacterium CGII-47]
MDAQNKLILFDFDGTLADTAPDLAAAANKQRTRLGLAPLPYEALRPYASHGARGLLKAALDLDRSHPDYEHWRIQFLKDYEQDITVHTCLFPGVAVLIDALVLRGYTWGIVTNKVEYLARPIIRHLGLEATCAVTVGGDTTPNPKPHPAPLLYAAEHAGGYPPNQCIYIGDDERDIQAGKAAGMATVAAAYGYCALEDPQTWAADAVAQQVPDILDIIEHWANAAVLPLR